MTAVTRPSPEQVLGLMKSRRVCPLVYGRANSGRGVAAADGSRPLGEQRQQPPSAQISGRSGSRGDSAGAVRVARHADAAASDDRHFDRPRGGGPGVAPVWQRSFRLYGRRHRRHEHDVDGAGARAWLLSGHLVQSIRRCRHAPAAAPHDSRVDLDRGPSEATGAGIALGRSRPVTARDLTYWEAIDHHDPPHEVEGVPGDHNSSAGRP